MKEKGKKGEGMGEVKGEGQSAMVNYGFECGGGGSEGWRNGEQGKVGQAGGI